MSVAESEQVPLFPDMPVEATGRRPLGRGVRHGSGGITAAVRMAVFALCMQGKRVTTDATGHPKARVRAAFRALERERMLRIRRRRCRNPLGYRLVASLHPRLAHLRRIPNTA